MGEIVPDAIRAVLSLTTYATTTRYPNAGTPPAPPVEEREYREAVAIDEVVVLWAEERL